MATTAGRIYLHIGLQKTGTSYLQSIVFESVDQLAAQGVAVVPPSKRRTFWVMLDVRARFRPDFDPPEVAESVDHFAQVLAESRAPSALLTEESLAPADPEQIARLLAACGDREVHVVVTLRDLGRQVPSAWQESLKAGASATFETYLTKLRLHEDTPGHGLWRQKDVPRLLAAWNAHVPSERIHVVTVPRPGSDPTLLLDRFCQVLGVDPSLLITDVVRVNEGLKHVGAEVLRRVNAELAPTHRKRDVYGDVGKRYLSTRILAQQPGERIAVPESFRAWLQSTSRRHIDYLAAQGFEVVGDLEDLYPDDRSFVGASTDPSPDEIADVAAKALAIVIGDEMDRRREVRANRAAKASRRSRNASGLRRRAAVRWARLRRRT